MFKKTMKFDDLDGNEVTQTFYFNYNKKEIAELLEFGYLTEYPPADPGRRLRLEEQMEKLKTPIEESGLTEQENTKQAYDIFQDLILDAYGEKGEDNVTFVKNTTLRNYWKSHVAFVELIFEFLENPRLGAEFLENCLPAKMVAKAKEDLLAENDGKLSQATLSEMVQEAQRRQDDPATRIEPGTDLNAPVAPVDEPVPAKQPEDLTPEDIEEMDDIAFNKLDASRLSQPTLMAAFKRRNKS